jgi:GNAT superfamily N-acetyltransferase
MRDQPETEPDAVVLRRATPADAPPIKALVDAAYVGYTALLGRTPMPMLTDFGAAIADHDVWVVVERHAGVEPERDANAGTGDEAIVAVIELVLRPADLWIDNVAVDPAWQGRGLGRRLLAFADDEARRLGRSALGLLTNERYLANIAMYERYGYRETHREPHQGTDLVYFRKRLPED